jgi:predicted transposase/invertase (TIGR01784 family)
MTTDELSEKYINLLTDFGFKKLFGTVVNKDLLIDFLNQLLPSHRQIADVTYKVNEQLGAGELERVAVYDIYCTSEKGEEFIVEIQRKSQRYFKDLTILYSTFPIQNSAEKGVNWNYQLPPVYTISLMDFKLEDRKAEDSFVHHIQLKDQENRVFYDKLDYIYIELPKFNKTIEELETRFEKWLFLIKQLNHLHDLHPKFQEQIFKKVFTMAELAKYNPDERSKYIESLNQYRDFKNVVDYAREEGLQQGIEQGEVKQLLKSIQSGLDKGYELKVIADINGISLDDLKVIIKDYGLGSNLD